jgi:hypothetical protein
MKLRITNCPLLAVTLAVIFAAVPSQAKAAYVLTIQQIAGNVVATGSGSFNLAALTLHEASVTASADLYPSVGLVIIGVESPGVDIYQGLSGPTNFGTGSSIESPTSAGGIITGVVSDSLLYVPEGYPSGAVLSGSAIWSGATFGSLGLTPGTYLSTWGSGATADSFTIDITAGAVPEPATWVMLVGGVGILFSFRARKSAMRERRA